MTDEELARFQQSLNRCTAHSKFLERFYELFMAGDPEIRDKFSNTNWLRQYRMMVASFHLMMLTEEDDGLGSEHMERVAHKHGPEKKDIPAWMYDKWLEALLTAAREHDPEFDDDVEDLWRHVMSRGIEFMKSRSSGAHQRVD